jgi:hypothetical protein
MTKLMTASTTIIIILFTSKQHRSSTRALRLTAGRHRLGDDREAKGRLLEHACQLLGVAVGLNGHKARRRHDRIREGRRHALQHATRLRPAQPQLRAQRPSLSLSVKQLHDEENVVHVHVLVCVRVRVRVCAAWPGLR